MEPQIRQTDKLEDRVNNLDLSVRNIDKRVSAIEIIFPRLEASVTELGGIVKDFSGIISKFELTLNDVKHGIDSNAEISKGLTAEVCKVKEKIEISESKMKTDWRDFIPQLVKYVVTGGGVTYILSDIINKFGGQ